MFAVLSIGFGITCYAAMELVSSLTVLFLLG